MRTNFAELDKMALVGYTTKWFVIWSFKIFVLAFVAFATLMTIMAMACKGGSRSE